MAVWQFVLIITATVMSLLAASVAVYYARVSQSGDVAKIRRELGSEIADLSSQVERLSHQVRKHHMRLAMRDHRAADAESENPAPAPTMKPLDDDASKDAIRKHLGAQAGIIGIRR